MAFYTQPAAANYNITPTHVQRQRGYRICDQCGAAESPSVPKFRLCSGCVRCHRSPIPSFVPNVIRSPHLDGHSVLCTCALTPNSVILLTRAPQSPECQKMHWPSHKSICKHTASQLSGVHQAAMGYPDENLAKCLRKFTSAHTDLLGWAGFQALQLKRLPANVRQNALLIELSFHNNHAESHRRWVTPNFLTADVPF